MKPQPYLVVVRGDLRAGDREWLSDLQVDGPLPGSLTAMWGTLDQSALHGLFRRLQHLALEIYEVHRLSTGSATGRRAEANAAVS
jgi:hypothetical protein